MALGAGQVIAGTSYQVVREIGAGGMGVVYEVEHVRLRKRYVAKVIHEQIRSDETAPKRMEREAQVLADINHPNVVQVHDVGVTPEGVSYFVMEKLEGTDLRHAMKEGKLSTSRAVAIAADVLDALEHVHRRGIVHRDIKPENIFLATTPAGFMTKVLDFGIVHIFDGERASHARITKTGGFVGTLYYAAPEQMQGLPAGPANDVYASGLVLFEMLAGRGPFDDDPGVGLSRCFKPAPRLPTSEHIPSAVADAVAAALEQDPAKRPPAGVLASRLRHTLSSLATDPGPAPGPRATVENLLAHLDVTTAAYGPTVPGPAVDTSSGVASSIQPFPKKQPRTPVALLIAAPLGGLVVLGLIAAAGITALRRAPSSATAVAVSASPLPSAAAPEPEPVVAAHALEAPAPAPAPAISVAKPSPAASLPAAPARPAPKPARGNAEKEGYMKADDL
jgi:serine/threonine-protein kinase